MRKGVGALLKTAWHEDDAIMRERRSWRESSSRSTEDKSSGGRKSRAMSAAGREVMEGVARR